MESREESDIYLGNNFGKIIMSTGQKPCKNTSIISPET